MIKKTSIFIFVIAIAFSCSDDSSPMPISTDNFDRSEMLRFWANEIIIPAYVEYNAAVNELEIAAAEFFSDPTQVRLQNFRETWLKAYLSWQSVSMFEIGKAEEIGLRNYTNIYPANTELIHSNITNQSYNLELPSNFAAQGFPALDYLLFGIENTDEDIIIALTSSKTASYVNAVISRMNQLSSDVLEDWNNNFKVVFIANNGSSATASTDKMVNDFLLYYEKFLRAAKIGMPAGIFSGSPNVNIVEAQYSNIYSKALFEKGFLTVRNFFNGISFDEQNQGPSLKQYLDDIHKDNDADYDFATSINTQWQTAENRLTEIKPNFKAQILEDNTKMLALYDELQKAVVTLKVDMMQALNIQIDFVDADGD